MQYLGDYAEDYATLNFKFSTHKADGTPIALAGTPAISVYKANGTTQSTAGITLSVDFDSVTGLNNVLIDLSADAFYAVASDYQVVITTGTVDSVSVVGTVLAHFSIENRNNKADVTKISGDSTAADNLESACDNYSATRGLAGTALPAAAADAAGGLPISDAGALDLDAKLANTNEITAARMGALTDLINGGRLDLILDDILTDTGTTLDALIKDIPTVAEFEARTLPAADYTVVSDLGTVQTGDSFAIVNGDHGLVSIQDDIDAILADTNELQTDWHDGGRLDLLLDGATAPTAAAVRAEIDNNSTQLAAAIAAIGALNDISTSDVLTQAASALNTYDPPTKAELDVAIAAVAGLTGSYARVITVQDGLGNNVIAANVEVWDSGNTTFYQRLQTNSSGQVTFNMDAGTYIIRIYKAGYTFANATLVITGAGSTTYNMTPFTTPTASNVNMCRVYGYFMTPEGGFYTTLTPSAVVEETYDSGNSFFKGDVTGGYVAATGLVYWDIVQGATARVRIQEIGYEAEITVPELSSSKLKDLV